MKFKVGDRVKAVAPCDDKEAFMGKVGVVRKIEKHWDLPVQVMFDEEVEYEDDDGDLMTAVFWWCEEGSLKLEEVIDYDALTEIEE